uniref:erythrocyte membrane protein band 4.2-like isoform X2 n=1 Tax=Podarcis muralis TaxID=64176 RepID=UPI00109F0FCE|nr:erythrocyte membrane protein band 4.2-like isoform X2 [Podarcis muralis]
MGQALQVSRCDLQPSRNNAAHRTAAVSTERLVVRRGQPFALTLHFREPLPGAPRRYLRKTCLVAQTGQRPSQKDGSLVRFPISRQGRQSGWQAFVDAPESLSWTLTVTSPADAAIGRYSLLLQHGRGAPRPLGTFTLLFNPWCQEDSVFLPNEAQRQEYVCNEEGTVYWGLEEAPQQQPWDYGQFQEDIVDLSLALPAIGLFWLQDAPCAQRSDPLHVCRLVSSMLNSKTHQAILEGGWTGDYSDGTSPFQWPGSAPILRRWLAARGQPVRYGQCWVFAGVLCTVLRSLGIPTRVVTSFASAQDTAGRLRVDEYFDESAALIPGLSEAAVWPFHAWNECWMARRDLPPGYDGWQAVDATPQEEGSYSSFCGPAPVRAIKEGRLDLPYDVATFFAATNATCAAWVRQDNGDFQRAFSSTKFVGNNLSTKAVGSDRCEDLTHHYKHPEGSAAERAVLNKVSHEQERLQDQIEGDSSPPQPPLAPPAQEDDTEPLLFAHIQAKSSWPLGQDAPVSVLVVNRTGEEKSLALVLGAQPLQYDGKALAQFWKEEYHFTLPSGHEEALSTTLPYAEYGPALRNNSLLLKLTALLRDTASHSNHLAWQEIHFCAPGLNIQVPERTAQFQATQAEIQLHNPLPEPLPGCLVSVSGWGLIHKTRSYRLGDIPAGSSTALRIPFTPTQAGPRRLTVQVESPLLQPLKACRTIQVGAAA